MWSVLLIVTIGTLLARLGVRSLQTAVLQALARGAGFVILGLLGLRLSRGLGTRLWRRASR